MKKYLSVWKIVAEQLAIQISIALGALLFFAFYFGITLSNLGPAFTFGLFLLPVTMGMVNVFSFYLIPQYLFSQRYLEFSLYTFYTLVISIFLITLSSFYGYLFINTIETIDREFIFTKNLYLIIVAVYIVVLLTSLFSTYRENIKIQLRNKELQFALVNGKLQLKQEELSYLKMQIHPHFLFNTLNTIYGSAIAQSKQTPELILKLSNLLDYILYQTKKQLVPLDEEIAHLKDYLALEKMRHGSRVKVICHFPDQTNGVMIAPMLLLPLVENCFKHGKFDKGDPSSELKIEINNQGLLFTSKNPYHENAPSGKLDSSGIGLQNIRKRLDLLYPNSYLFETNQSSGIFAVKLELHSLTPKLTTT
ncbi:sensor histidine kinase [Algoriphagus formosus]|uniref:Histidine kinase n=1 Tax=Algoriphagus formosus TaxID=2007308 RepID=A0A4R5UXT4_9BACT|nr:MULTISPECIES: histidine kinase [Algoriphagus]TDK44170.1 histidine kinase [Algoriphagus aquimaris]